MESISVIGGADGPTAIFVANNMAFAKIGLLVAVLSVALVGGIFIYFALKHRK